MRDEVAVKAELKSTRTKLFYGFGSVAFGVKDNGFQTILLPFYQLVVHLPAQMVGLAIGIALVFDAVIDPIVGQVSDNLHTRWGRRHPFMYASALPVALSYLLLWNPPDWSPVALFAYLVIVAVIVRTFITCYEIPSSALVPELTEDYDQRTAFLSYRVFFGWYGGLVMQVLALFAFMRPDAAHPKGQLNPAGYHLYGIVAGVVMFTAIIISAWGTHKFIPYFREPERRQNSVWQYAKEMFATLNNRPFLILMSSCVLLYLATGLVYGLNFYIMTFYWQLSAAQMGTLALALFIAVLLAFFIAPIVSRRFGKKRAAIGMFTTGFFISATPLFLSFAGLFVPMGSPLLVPTLFVFATIGPVFSIGSSVMIGAMIADVVEDSELKTGRRSEGLFFAGNSFLQKAVSGFGVLGSGIILWATGLTSDALPGKVDHAIVMNFVITYLIAHALLYLLGFIILAYFPIDRQSHADNLKQLAAEVAQAAEPVNLGVEP